MKRRLLKSLAAASCCAVAVICISNVTMRAAAGDERALSFYNIHTKENLSIVYKRNGQFVPEALEQYNQFMRDWRRNVVIKMDPELLDLIWEIKKEVGSVQPTHIICGHRSSGTNNNLRRTRGGQAKNSLHITGKAIDLHFPDVPVKELRNSALVRERGGVGYYPTSGIPFVHVDTGRVRHWPRIPRQDLAILYPRGKSQHVPSDGRPITKADFTAALAKAEGAGAAIPAATRFALGRAPAPGPVLASLGPASLPFGLSKPKAPAPAALSPSIQTAALTVEPVTPSITPTAVNVTDQPAPDLAGREFGSGFVTAALPPAGASLDEDQISRAPDYDDDHPDESSYQPFPIMPLLTDSPLAYADFTREPKPASKLVQAIAPASPNSLSVEFARGPQYEGMYWAQRFTGKAVSGAVNKFVASEDASSVAVKTAQSAPPR